MKVGFTGTQRGMTPAQRAAVAKWLDTHDVTEAHHGDCIGADAEFDELLEERGIPTIIHPPTIATKRAWRFRLWSTQMKFSEALGHAPPKRTRVIELPPRPYLVRNRDVVDAPKSLLAAPGEVTEQLRSGTWATVRHAMKRRFPIRGFWPDGGTARLWPVEAA